MAQLMLFNAPDVVGGAVTAPVPCGPATQPAIPAITESHDVKLSKHTPLRSTYGQYG